MTLPAHPTNPRRAVMGEGRREALAKIIASAMGDNYADAFKNKERWIAKRGQSGGRFRDVNEPYQSDYLDAADAAIAFLAATGGHNAD
jgi:hypothetical protein